MVDPPAEPEKLEWTRGRGVALGRLPAVLDEHFSRDQITAAHEPVLIFDFDRVRLITSPAIGAWTTGLASLQTTYCGFINCRPPIITQMNMIHNFARKAEIISLYAPYLCDDCGEFNLFIDRRVPGALQRILPGNPEPCPRCQKPAQFDDLPDLYFAFLSTQPEPRVPPLAELAISGKIETQTLKLSARKEVIGNLPVIRLGGGLDQRVRLERLFAGAEGAILLDLADLEAIDPGARLGEAFADPALEVRVADLTTLLFAALTDDQKKALHGRVVSMLVPGTCVRCHTAQQARSGLEGDELQMKAVCKRCGGSVVPDALPAVPPGFLTSDISAGVEEWLTLQGESPGWTPQSGRVIFADRYEIVRAIGRGGMGEVHLARQRGPAGFEKEVVLKRIAPQSHRHEAVLTANLLREARIAARVSHPNVVQIFDLGVDGDTYFVAMEYVRGWNLRAVIQRCNEQGIQMPIEIACRIAIDVCAGLGGAQTCADENGVPLGIIHRDMSPENVLVAKSGIVKVTDFGLAILATDVLREDEKMAPSGKPRYFAPEQFGGASKLDTRVDIFAVGLMLYEALTTMHPFERENDWMTLKAIAEAPLPSLRLARPDCPPELERIVARALERDLDKRYATPADMQAELEAFALTLPRPATSANLATWLDGFLKDASSGDNHPTQSDGKSRP
ncbi:MAG: serine/threonine protein kinase [Deltaproteobacteria bacterium]|nr:serine/threonine protein kinase [Deltaproteobacteria bacterium]